MESNSTASEGRSPAPCSPSSDTPETDEFRKLWPDGRRHNWPCSFESDALAKIEKLERERNALQSIFDLRWAADLRAINRWQAVHPGNDLTWPDHADMVVWMMDQLSLENSFINQPVEFAPDHRPVDDGGK